MIKLAKKKRRYKKRKTASKLDIAVVILIVVSILLAVLIYTKSGMVVQKLNEIFVGMFGIIQYVLPIGIFVIAIKIASNGNEDLNPKLIQYAVFLFSLCVLFSLFQIAAGEIRTNGELSEIVSEAYSIGTQSKGGGAIRSCCCCATK